MSENKTPASANIVQSQMLQSRGGQQRKDLQDNQSGLDVSEGGGLGSNTLHP